MTFNDWVGALAYVAVAAVTIGGAGLLTAELGETATAALAVGVPPLRWP